MVDLENAFRELSEAPEPPGLAAPSGVRRRGERRRRGARAGAVVVVAVLAVGTVAAVEATRSNHSSNGAALPATGTDPTPSGIVPTDIGPSVLPEATFLQRRDIPAIGPYQTFPTAHDVSPGEAFRLVCSAAPAAPSSWNGVREVKRIQYDSDLEATLQETVVLFDDEQSAIDATASFGGVCEPGKGLQGVTTQARELTTIQGGQRAVVAMPSGDAEIGYNEQAYARSGRLLVVLDWASTGLPHGEDAKSALSWKWAMPEHLVATALERASGQG